MSEAKLIIEQTSRWLERFVVGLELCPFAKRPWEEGRICIKVVQEDGQMPIWNTLVECSQITLSEEEQIETALVICPDLTLRFEEMYDWTADMQDVIDELGLDVQLVAFHPEFVYAGSDPSDTTNATNRSPYPMIHILNNADLAKIRMGGYDVERLTANNQDLLAKMSWAEIRNTTDL